MWHLPANRDAIPHAKVQMSNTGLQLRPMVSWRKMRWLEVVFTAHRLQMVRSVTINTQPLRKIGSHVGLLCPHLRPLSSSTVYPKKYAHGFCFAVLCCGYTLTDLPISIRLTSLALWQSNDCPSASKATLVNMDKYFMWIHYERLHNHNKAKHNKTVCIFLGIYCSWWDNSESTVSNM